MNAGEFAIAEDLGLVGVLVVHDGEDAGLEEREGLDGWPVLAHLPEPIERHKWDG